MAEIDAGDADGCAGPTKLEHLQPCLVGQPFVVVVAEGDQLAPRHGGPGVAAAGQPRGVIVAGHPHRALLAGDHERLVRLAPVEHDDALDPTLVVLPENGSDGLAKQFGAIAGADHCADRGPAVIGIARGVAGRHVRLLRADSRARA